MSQFCQRVWKIRELTKIPLRLENVRAVVLQWSCLDCGSIFFVWVKETLQLLSDFIFCLSSLKQEHGERKQICWALKWPGSDLMFPPLCVRMVGLDPGELIANSRFRELSQLWLHFLPTARYGRGDKHIRKADCCFVGLEMRGKDVGSQGNHTFLSCKHPAFICTASSHPVR